MRNISRSAAVSAGLGLVATLAFAGEDSVRIPRVLEVPDDLARVYAEACSALCYDTGQDCYLLPALGVSYDYRAGRYRNLQTQATTSAWPAARYQPLDPVDCYGHSYDPESNLYFDGMGYYDLATGRSYYYDAMDEAYYDDETGERYERNPSVGQSHSAWSKEQIAGVNRLFLDFDFGWRNRLAPTGEQLRYRNRVARHLRDESASRPRRDAADVGS